MPGLISNIYSFGDGLKRSVRGLLDDPVGELDVRARRIAEDSTGTDYEQRNWLNALRGDVMADQNALASYTDKIRNTAMNMATAGIVAPGYGPGLISSQRYIDDGVVAKKIAAKDFDVQVSPEFIVDGEKLIAIVDGHHSLAAANNAGVRPRFIVQTARDNDTIGLINNGLIDDFLESSYVDSPWHYIENGKDVW